MKDGMFTTEVGWLWGPKRSSNWNSVWRGVWNTKDLAFGNSNWQVDQQKKTYSKYHEFLLPTKNWWFQPLLKNLLVRNGFIFPKFLGWKFQKSLKPPPTKTRFHVGPNSDAQKLHHPSLIGARVVSMPVATCRFSHMHWWHCCKQPVDWRKNNANESLFFCWKVEIVL